MGPARHPAVLCEDLVYEEVVSGRVSSRWVPERRPRGTLRREADSRAQGLQGRSCGQRWFCGSLFCPLAGAPPARLHQTSGETWASQGPHVTGRGCGRARGTFRSAAGDPSVPPCRTATALNPGRGRQLPTGCELGRDQGAGRAWACPARTRPLLLGDAGSQLHPRTEEVTHQAWSVRWGSPSPGPQALASWRPGLRGEQHPCKDD